MLAGSAAEQILSDEIECFWLPSNPAPLPPVAAAPAPAASRSSSSIALPSGPAHSRQASRASLAREDSLASSLAGAFAAAAAAAGSELSGPVSSFGGRESEALSSGAGESSRGDLAPRQPHVEMPWWTHGARGMQVGV